MRVLTTSRPIRGCTLAPTKRDDILPLDLAREVGADAVGPLVVQCSCILYSTALVLYVVVERGGGWELREAAVAGCGAADRFAG